MADQAPGEVNFAEVEQFTLCGEVCLPTMSKGFFSLLRTGEFVGPRGLRSLEFEVINSLGQRGRITFRFTGPLSERIHVTACTNEGEPFVFPTPTQYAAVRYDRDHLGADQYR